MSADPHLPQGKCHQGKTEMNHLSDLLTSPSCQVSWARDRHHHTLTTPYRLRLASVDSHSHCVVWDVTQGTVAAEFSLGAKPLVDLQWLETNVSCTPLHNGGSNAFCLPTSLDGVYFYESHCSKSCVCMCLHVFLYQDSCRDLLAVMLTPGVMTIWNADTGTKVSRFTFTETILSFAFNPFQQENLVRESCDMHVTFKGSV